MAVRDIFIFNASIAENQRNYSGSEIYKIGLSSNIIVI